MDDITHVKSLLLIRMARGQQPCQMLTASSRGLSVVSFTQKLFNRLVRDQGIVEELGPHMNKAAVISVKLRCSNGFSGQGLTLSGAANWGPIILCCGAILGVVGCLAAPLASTHRMPVAP